MSTSDSEPFVPNAERAATSSIPVLGPMRFLVTRELERSLASTPRFWSRKDAAWSPAVCESGLLIDLSRTEWVDIPALVQLVVLVEAALRDGIRVRVALPLGRRRRSEAKFATRQGFSSAVDLLDHRVARRAATRRFLDYLRFEPSLRAPFEWGATGRLEILPDYDPGEEHVDSGSGANATDEDTGISDRELAVLEAAVMRQPSEEEEVRYLRVRPLTWVTVGDMAEARKIAEALALVAGDPERGLARVDADVLANVILYELIDNVSRHAGGAGRALVAAWARPAETPLVPPSYLPWERSFVEWARGCEVPIVELAVGDSGHGLHRVLAEEYRLAVSRGAIVEDLRLRPDARVIAWAWDRWSTSTKSEERRGTRGLYRVDRVVRMYEGLMTVRAGAEHVGWDHGGRAYDEPIYNRTALATIPGTVIRLLIPVFSVTSERPSLGRVASHAADLQVQIIQLGSILQSGFSAEDEHRMQTVLAAASMDRPVCVVAVVRGGDHRGVEAALRRAAELRHPGMLVLAGMPMSANALNTAVNSVNLDHDKHHRADLAHTSAHFEIWDPVLVLGPGGEAEWVGASSSFRVLLHRLLASEQGKISAEDLRHLIPPATREEVLRRIRSDAQLVYFSEDGGLALRATLADIVARTSQAIRDEVASQCAQNPNTVYLTPSLLPVRSWLKVGQLLDEVCGVEFATLTLTLLARQHPAISVVPPAVILADSTADDRGVHALKVGLGAKRTETIPGEAGVERAAGTPYLSAQSTVVVHCDVLLSGEAGRRCLKQVLRDGAYPLLVTCFLDAREAPGTPLQVLGEEVPVISLSEVDLLAPPHEVRKAEIKVVNPVTLEPDEPVERQTIDYPIPEENLYKLIWQQQALHFSHIGRPIGRHFTFYLAVDKLVMEQEVTDSINMIVSEWSGRNGNTQHSDWESTLEVWYPAPEPNAPAPAKQLGEWLKERRRDVIRTRAVRRADAFGQWLFTAGPVEQVAASEVVIVDWGALAGTTITQMLRQAAESGAQRVLVCVLLSQLPADQESFLTNIQSVHGKRLPRPKADQLEMLEGIQMVAERTDVPVTVRFLSRLPLGAYLVDDCPMCQHLRDLSQHHLPTRLLASFAARTRDRRLKLRTRKDALGNEPVGVDGQVIKPAEILVMVQWRRQLESALSSTVVRQEISREITALATGEVGSPSEHGHRIRALVHFLSVETHWLRRPPLNLEHLRASLASIASSIVLDRNGDRVERLHALMVLRISSKRRFVRELKSLYLAITPDRELAQQLLFDTFTYIQRPYHVTEGMLAPVRDALNEIADLIRRRPSAFGEAMSGTVHRLAHTAGAALAKSRARHLAPPVAWASLREAYDKRFRGSHDDIAKAFAWMYPGPYRAEIEQATSHRGPASDVRPSPGVQDWLGGLSGEWSKCCEFLDHEVLPRLGRLERVLETRDAARALNYETVVWLTGMLSRGSSFADERFTRLVRNLSDHPRRYPTRSQWTTYKEELRWYADRLLGRPPSKNPWLMEFLETAPSNLFKEVMDVYSRFRRLLPGAKVSINTATLKTAPPVFCTKRLLNNTIEELLENLIRHRVNEKAQTRVQIYAIVEARTIDLYILNDNTSEDVGKSAAGTGELGLSSLRERLQGFSGSLETRTLSGTWATFRAVVHLTPWG
jgi:hypothetical protein